MKLCFLFTSLILCVFLIAIVRGQHQNISEALWDLQFKRGDWDYLGKNAIERARSSIISGVFALEYAPKGRILDIGCGEGVLSDYLNEDQKKLYLGLDLSQEAIKLAKKKRGNLNFIQGDALLYVPPAGELFDVIIFNEVIYYMDHLAVLKQYSSSKYLAKNGIIVLSIWHTNKAELLKSPTVPDARAMLESIDAISLSGATVWPGKIKSSVHFHIEAFRVKS